MRNDIPTKSTIMIAQLGATHGSTSTGLVDTLGFNFLTVDLVTSPASAPDKGPNYVKFEESDDGADWTDIYKLVSDGSESVYFLWDVPWFTDAAGQKPVKFNVDLRARRRYLRLSVVPRETMDLYAFANLMDTATNPPSDAASAGVLFLVSA